MRKTRSPKPETRSSKGRARFRAAGWLVLLLLALATPAVAVKTEHWDLKSTADFLRGKLHRVSLSNEGELHLGYGSTRLGEFAREIWCTVVGADGTIFFGTGTPADVYAVGKDGKAAKLFETDAIAVTALAMDSRGNLYAATLAEGKIFKIAADKKQGAEFCKLRAPYVWALVVDKQDHLFAATGPDGRVYRISPEGKAEEWYATEESNLLCLALDADGALLAGGSDRGLLYKITDKNKGAVLHEFSEDEVKTLLVRGGDLYAGVNRQKVKRPRVPARRATAAEFEDLTQRLSAQFGGHPPIEPTGPGRETPPEARMANLLSGTLYVRHADGRVDKLAGWDNESILSMAAEQDGSVLTAMAGAGRVYRVRDGHGWEMLFDFDEQQTLALAVRNGRLVLVGTGNVGSAYAIDAERARDGEFISDVRDCRFLTTWGNVSWLGQGDITVSTRSGNTALPDATWSAWSDPVKASPGAVASPRSRFIQVRAQLANQADPVLRTLNLYYTMQNQKPEIASVEVGERAKAGPEKSKPESPGDLTAAIAETGTGEKKPPERKAEEVRPKPPSPLKKIAWRASDKDGDTLVYRLYYQGNSDEPWTAIPLDKPLKTTEYSWDTDSIPDGWYRVKVAASDEESNPAGQALTDEKTGNLFKIDNTRPAVLQLALDPAAAVLSGVARDNLSLIASLEYSVDGGEWKFFAPKDGVFDDREEAFAVKIEPLTAGTHAVAVRAADEEGNVGVERIVVKVK